MITVQVKLQKSSMTSLIQFRSPQTIANLILGIPAIQLAMKKLFHPQTDPQTNL